MQANEHLPNIRTFGCLAFKVGNSNQLVSFLNDLDKFKFEMNVVIASTLVSNAFYHFNFKMLSMVLDAIRNGKIKVNDRFMKDLEVTVDKTKELLIDMERRHPIISQNTVDENTFENYNKIRRFYKSLGPYYKTWKSETWNLVDNKNEE